MTGPPTSLGPCGDPALVPRVELRLVSTSDGPKVEIALLSDPYGWRVRSWWSPAEAQELAARIAAVADAPFDLLTGEGQ